MRSPSSEVILSVAEADPAAVARRLAEVPPGCARVEIRADRLRSADLPGLIAASPRPVLVSARRPQDGGRFEGSEEERRALLLAALAAGAGIDVEWGSALAALAEGPEAGRVVLSHHGGPCREEAMTPVFQAMAGSRAWRLKLVPRASRPSEGVAVRDLLARARAGGRALACFAMGEAGVATRVLATAWGSWATYGAAEQGAPTGDGQLPARMLLEVHAVASLTERTRLFGLVGRPIDRSPSPAMHHAGYRALGLDACFLAFPTAEPGEVEAVVARFGLEGLAVTIPLKEAVAARCTEGDLLARTAGAVNTVRVEADRWRGFNTDGVGALRLVRRVLDPARRRILVLGAGGTAAGIGAALAAAGGAVAICGRTPSRAAALAARLRAEVVPWEGRAGARWDVLVQTTPLGREGEEVLPAAALSGSFVLDAAYGASRPTPLVAAAGARGIAVADGIDLLLAQATPQFRHLTGREIGPEVLAAAVRMPQPSGGPS